MGTCRCQERGEPSRLGLGNAAAEGRESVVSATLVVLFGRRALARLFDQPLLEHPLDRAVESPRAHPQAAGRALGHVLHHGVAVGVAGGEGDEDVEDGGRKREEVVKLHSPYYIRSRYIVLRHSWGQADQVTAAAGGAAISPVAERK